MIKNRFMFLFSLIYFSLILFFLLSKLSFISKIHEILLFIASFFMIIHIIWGISFLIIKIDVPKTILEFLLSGIIFFLIALSINFLSVPRIWFLIYSLCFFLVVIFYSLLKLRLKDDTKVNFLKEKISAEKFAIIFFFLGYIALTFFNLALINIIFSALAIFVQIPFLVYTFFVKRLYSIKH